MKVVIVSHQNNDNRQYLFSVPHDFFLKKGELVQVKTRRGLTYGECLCDDFEVGNALEPLAAQYGATLPLAPVVATYILFNYSSPLGGPGDPMNTAAGDVQNDYGIATETNADTPVMFAS